MSPLRNTTAPPSRGRHIARVVTAIGIAAFMGGLAACSDAPLSPSNDRAAAVPRPSQNGVGLGAGYNVPLATPVSAEGVKRGTPLAAPISASFDVGRSGGHFSLPGTGLSVLVPSNALDQPTRITVTALPGEAVAYDFQPHGLVFRRPLQMTQDLRGTNWDRRAGASFDVGYFPTPDQVDPSTGTARVSELLQGYLDTRGVRLQFDVYHFSGYIVAWGRSYSWY